jgi:hypothetical protein
MEPAEGRDTEGGRGFVTGGEAIGLEEHGGGERSGGFGKVLGDGKPLQENCCGGV